MQRTQPVTNIKELTVLSVFAALMIVSQVALASLPNIELVTLFIILITHRCGIKALLPVYTFVLAEGLIYGFNLWWICYLYVWALLVLAVCAIKKHGGVIAYTIIAAMFGILFGTLCSIPYFAVGGAAMGFSWIVSGLSFDITHCIGNAVSVALLYYPLDRALCRCVTFR